jgi:hypothetical protein
VGYALHSCPYIALNRLETDLFLRSNYQSALTQQLEALSLGQATMKAEDLREIGDLGSGNGGSVKKVTHLPTGTTMAKKVRTVPPI